MTAASRDDVVLTPLAIGPTWSRVVRAIRIVICGLCGGHEWFVVRQGGRVYLRCVCGAESTGWHVHAGQSQE